MIPITYIRSSSLKEWQNCQLRCFSNYCLGLKYPGSPATVIGSIVHEILEILANNQNTTDDELEILTQNIYQKYIDTIDYSRVPPSSQRKTPEASVKAWIPLRKVKTSIKNLMAMSPRSFDVRKMNIVAAEQKFDIELNYPWSTYDFIFRGKHYHGNVRLKGSIDLVVKNNDGTCELIDWKSGRSEDLMTGEPRTFESYADDIQLGLYSMVCQKYLGYDISHVTIVFINEGVCYSVQFDPDLVMERIKSIYLEMKNCTRPTRHNTIFCSRFCQLCNNTFETLKSDPLVKPRSYDWIDPDTGIEENRVYKMCGQIDLYGKSGCTPLEIMEAITRKNFDINEYRNI